MAIEPLLPDLRVVEIGQYIAAPFAATIFADQGAEVIKIERPGGDPYRRDPARFAAWNRRKTSVVLDLASARARAEALELIDRADVLIENLRPGAMARLGLPPDGLRDGRPRLVTCSISAYGSAGPARDEPGWEPLVHARAGAQQGLFTGDQPIWLPFPMASVAAALLAVIGCGAALLKRETTGYGQHVETSLLEALLFLNAGAIFHRPRHPPPIVRAGGTPVLRIYETLDGRGMQVNLSGTERWRELCRVLQLDDDGGLDFSDPVGLAKLADPEWCHTMRDRVSRRYASRSADEWEEALLASPAATAKCNTLEEWLAHPQARANHVFAPGDDHTFGDVPLVAPPIQVATDGRHSRTPRRHGTEGGALAGHRVVDLSSFWAGPLAARILAELGADVVKVQPLGGEGAYHLVPLLPNIYVDGNRSKRSITLELRREEDRRRLLDLISASDVVVENALAGTWERLGLGEDQLRAANPGIVYARAKGFGSDGPLASRPTFDYVVQAATGMEMTQGGGRPQPVNFTANDYCTGLHLAAGIVLALLARADGAAVTRLEASLMMTATVFQSEHVAELAAYGRRADAVGADLRGPTPGRHLYEGTDGWVAVCAADVGQEAAVGTALGIVDVDVAAVAAVIKAMTVDAACARFRAVGVPATRSVHPGAVPGDVHVRDRTLLTTVHHDGLGPFVQVGIPLRLSVDAPAVKGGAPTPDHGRRPGRERR